jgi:hypothetical protein
MKGARLLFLAGWVVLLLVSAGIALASLGSLSVAYRSAADNLVPGYSTVQIGEQGGEEAAKAFRGRRVTAATWALGYGLLAFVVTLVPYRKGERWAWWALLASMVTSQLLSMMRVVMVGTVVGAGTSGVLLAFTLLGLLAGVPRIFANPSAQLDQ